MASIKINTGATTTQEVHAYLANQIAEEATRLAKQGGYLPGTYEHIFIPSEEGDLSVIYRGDLKDYHDKLTQVANQATMTVLTKQENAEMFVGLLLGVARKGRDWFDEFGAGSQ